MFKNYLLIVLTLTSLAMLGAQDGGDRPVLPSQPATDPVATENTTPVAAETEQTNNDVKTSKEETSATTENEVDSETETTSEVSAEEKALQESKRNTVFDRAPVISKFRPQYIIMGKNAICSIEGESIIITPEEVEKALTAAYDHLKSLAKPEEEFDKRSYVYTRDQIIVDLLANREKSIVQAYGRRLSTTGDSSEGGESKEKEEGSSKKEDPANQNPPATEQTQTAAESKPTDEKSNTSKAEDTESGETKDFIYLNIFSLNNSVRDKPIARNEYMSEDTSHWRISYDLNSGEVFNLLLN